MTSESEFPAINSSQENQKVKHGIDIRSRLVFLFRNLAVRLSSFWLLSVATGIVTLLVYSGSSFLILIGTLGFFSFVIVFGIYIWRVFKWLRVSLHNYWTNHTPPYNEIDGHWKGVFQNRSTIPWASYNSTHISEYEDKQFSTAYGEWILNSIYTVVVFFVLLVPLGLLMQRGLLEEMAAVQGHQVSIGVSIISILAGEVIGVLFVLANATSGFLTSQQIIVFFSVGIFIGVFLSAAMQNAIFILENWHYRKLRIMSEENDTGELVNTAILTLFFGSLLFPIIYLILGLFKLVFKIMQAYISS